MLSKIINNIHWIDVLIIGMTIRIIYIGLTNGFVIELFKLLGILAAAFISFHYYSGLAKFLHEHIAIPESVLNIICFALLIFLVLWLSKFISEGISVVLKVNAHPLLDKWGALVIAMIRSLFVSSVVLVVASLSGFNYLKESARESLLNPYLIDLSPQFYKSCMNGFVIKFFSKEKINPVILKLEREAL